MMIARVVDRQVASEKHASLEGAKLLWVMEVAPDGVAVGAPFLAVDAVGAGADETVLVTTEGGASTMATGRSRSPVDAAVVGIVDAVEHLPARAARDEPEAEPKERARVVRGAELTRLPVNPRPSRRRGRESFGEPSLRGFP